MTTPNQAASRRMDDTVFLHRYLTGEGIDLARSEDRLQAQIERFPGITRLLWWDLSLGGESGMSGVEDASLDFVHAHRCLADQDDPSRTLSRWLDLLKDGGHAIVTVPDEDRCKNAASKWRFTVSKVESLHAWSMNATDLVRSVAHAAECERMTIVDETGEIELVLRKRAGPPLQDLLGAVVQAKSADGCVAACERAIAYHPYRFEPYHISAIMLQNWERLDSIDSVWARCVARFGAAHPPRLYQALHLIARGKLNEGFALREALLASKGWQRRTKAEPPAKTPAWQGEPLRGKSIVIWSEFGLGDEIFFFRFARILRERAGASRVSVVCQSPLTELFRASGEADAIIDIAGAATAPEHDFWVYPHAIPAYFPLDLEALPSSVPYLRASREAPDEIARVARGVLKVGIAFKGDPTHENDRSRSLPSIATLDPLFALEGIEFFSFQKGAGADEAADYAKKLPHFHDIGARMNSMAESAGAMAALDLIVTVDTSVAHLAGALGKPVWSMLPAYGDWRWHYTREDSPWYPQMRLFRCQRDSGWEEVVGRIVGQLRELRHDAARG